MNRNGRARKSNQIVAIAYFWTLYNSILWLKLKRGGREEGDLRRMLGPKFDISYLLGNRIWIIII